MDVANDEMESSLLVLNNDCIDVILGYLSPEDVCSMSFTCQQVQQVAFEHFRRKYSSKFTNVTVLLEKKPHMKNITCRLNHHETYLKHFLSYVPIKRIECNWIGVKDLVNFMEKHCCYGPEIHFVGNLKSIDEDIEISIDQLHHIESISI